MEDELNSPLPQSKDANFSSKRLKFSGNLWNLNNYIPYPIKTIMYFCFNDNLPNTNTVFSSTKQLQKEELNYCNVL